MAENPAFANAIIGMQLDATHGSRHDRVSDLPSELRVHTLRLLDIQDLCSAAAVSTTWQTHVAELIHQPHPEARLGLEVRQRCAPCAHRVSLSGLQRHKGLVAAGGYNSSFNDHEHVAMADDGPGCERTAELVCGLRGVMPHTWNQLPDMMSRRADLALVSGHSSTMFAVGGREGGTAHASVERLNLARWQLFGEGWQPAGQLREPRYGLVAARVGDVMIAAGGAAQGSATNACELYRYDRNHSDAPYSFTPSAAIASASPMHHPRLYGAAATLHDHLYVLGGGDRRTSRTAECLDVGTGEWLELPKMRVRRYGAAAVAHEGRILAFGGESASGFLVEAYDPRAGRWQLEQAHVASPGPYFWGCSAFVHGDLLIVTGGAQPDNAAAALGSNAAARGPDKSKRQIHCVDLRTNFPLASRGTVKLQTPRWLGAMCAVDMLC